ncbi:type IV conjugative transfer system pilin TraA [Serratia proteamaculans]|uniref:type IV conjugative transfer system pilin TraA n=1 Tax=Serratia proteamaculans TaxID=28151 RepID=UPI0039BE8696
MDFKSNTLKAVKGWAVASLNFGRKNKALLTTVGAATVATMVATSPALATTTDLFASQQAVVKATFGHGSSIEKWFYYAEIILGLFLYIKARNPLVFVGLALVVLFTRIAFTIAG